MQPRSAAPRTHLSTSQVEAILKGESVEVSAGMERVDASGTVLEDLSDALAGGTVSHNNYATIHSTCRLLIQDTLDFGSARVRLFLTLKGQDEEARFDLGTYVLSTPARNVGEYPQTFDVEGYGVLTFLNTPAGMTYQVPAGANVVDEVRTILDTYGAGTPHFIEESSATLASARVWPLDEGTTWLHIVNDLLRSIGFRGLWEDWTGRFRSEPYSSPANRAVEWHYDADAATTILHEDGQVEADYFDTPNRWVFVRQDPAAADISVPGSSDVYEVTNQSDGPTSIDARGFTRTAVHFLDAVDSAALQAQGDSIVDRDKRLDRTYRIATEANPLHWHFDVVTLHDTDLGSVPKLVSHEWTLDLGEGSMTHVLRQV